MRTPPSHMNFGCYHKFIQEFSEFSLHSLENYPLPFHHALSVYSLHAHARTSINISI